MWGVLLCSWLILNLSSLPGVLSFCTDVSYDDCREYLQHEHKFVESRDICQKLCNIFNENDECDFYRFIYDTQYGYNCFIYTEGFSVYNSFCDSVSSTRNIDEGCLNPTEGSCFVTQSSRCFYRGHRLEHFESPNQEYCADLCDTFPDCQRWVFYRESKICDLLDSADQQCEEIFGPPSLSPEECGEAPPLKTTPQQGSTVSTQACDSNTVDLYPDLGNCGMYYQCTEGSLTHQSCPDCDRFDIETKFCDSPEEVDCQGRPHDDTCKVTTKAGDCPLDSGTFPKMDDCFKYVVCDNGNPDYFICGKEADETGYYQQLLYHNDAGICDWSYRVECGTRPLCDENGFCQCQHADPVTPGSQCLNTQGSLFVANAFNCQSVLVCRDGELIFDIRCPEDQFVDPITFECVSDEAVCNNRPICVEAGGDNQHCRCVP